jgi:hypothetical protein
VEVRPRCGRDLHRLGHRRVPLTIPLSGSRRAPEKG